MLVLGVDPGVSGAAAVIDEDYRVVQWYRFAKLAMGGAGFAKNRMDGRWFAQWLLDVGPVDHAVVEFPAFVGTNNAASQVVMFAALGCAEGVIDAAGIGQERVPARRWKKAIGLIGQPKRESKVRMLELHPEMEGARVNQGIAEAILIARYGLKYLINGAQT